MIFDVVIGHPPHQENGEADSSAGPLYDKFVEQAKELNPKYISMIMPARWMTDGETELDSFREINMKDRRWKEIHDYENDADIFPNSDIDGGVMYFLWDCEHDGELDYYEHVEGKEIYSKRFLDTGHSIIVRNSDAIGILKNINLKNEPFSRIVSTDLPYGLDADIIKKEPKLFIDKKDELHDVEFYDWNDNPQVKYIKRKSLRRNNGLDGGPDLIDCWKVLMLKSFLQEPFLVAPGTACSDIYYVIGSFADEHEAENAKKYILTKFFKFLVFQKKKTKNVSHDLFELVPIQDFSRKSKVPWNKSVEELDKYFFNNYNLSKQEIDFIKEKVG